MKTISLLAAAFGLAALFPMQASGSDRRDHFDRRGPRVIVYEDANYRGESMTIYLGERLDNLKRVRLDGGMIANDQISSVRVLGGATVLFYDHPNMGGQVLRVTEDISNLDYRMMPDTRIAWNDRISSLQVSGRGHHGSGNFDRPVAVKDPERMITQAYQEVLGRPVDPQGLRYYRSLVIDQGWSERMVVTHLRESAEYRGESVDRIIRRAYEDILNREPDPAGLANYRRMMIHENWTERQVRDAMRNSPESRNRT